MPRFFFDCLDDGRRVVDDEGVELPSLEAAKAMAAKTLAELARDVLPASRERHIAIDVRNEAGQALLTTEMTFCVHSLQAD